jgi:hypothetical protein
VGAKILNLFPYSCHLKEEKVSVLLNGGKDEDAEKFDDCCCMDLLCWYGFSGMGAIESPARTSVSDVDTHPSKRNDD